MSLPEALAATSLEEKRALLARLLRRKEGSAPRAFELVSEACRQRLPDGVEDAYPLTRLQRGMLFHSEYAPRQGLYHDVFRYTLRARWDPAAMEEAAARWAARHPVLRTSFDLAQEGEPLQRVHAAVRIPVAVHTLAGLNDEQQLRALAAWREDEIRRGFEWSRPPLCRLALHRVEDDLFHLTLSFHHAILDGWSVALGLGELLRLYSALVRGEEPAPEPPPQATFREYVALERQIVDSAPARGDLLRLLADPTRGALPRWPTRRLEDRRAQVEKVALDGAPLADLGALARRQHVPIRTLLLAAHLRVLAVFSGQTDVLTGLVLGGRPEGEGGDRVLGLFLNTLPLRLTLPGGSWEELIRATFQAEAELLPLRRYPLAELQRHLGGEPLFETAFNFVHLHAYEQLAEVPGLQVVDARFDEVTNFALMANFRQHGAGIDLELAYSPADLDPEQVRRIGCAYARSLTAMVAASGGRYDLLPQLTAVERCQLLVEWNDTRVEVPQGCIQNLFETEAERRPAAIALEWGHHRLSYSEVEAAANRLAHHLRRFGVGPEARVGLALGRSHELVIAVLAVLKAGGAYVPLDPSFPPERLAFMAEDAGLSVLVTTEGLVPDLSPAGARLVFTDRDAAAIASEPATRPRGGAAPENLAYLIYTSGSTGRPKGVQIPHAAVRNLLISMAGRLALQPADRFLAVTTLSFDISVLELLLPLAVGATVVVGPAGGTALEETLALLGDGRLAAMQATPSHWRLLLDAGWRGTAGLKALCGGEALPPDLAARLGAACRELRNVYGPTETTIWSTCRALGPGERISLGRPLDNTVVYIAARDLELAPAGTPGELLIGGAGLARGYFGRPELTAERFVPDPFSGRPGARLYRSGDLARWLPVGELEFLGRIDHQVKIRGFRIELGEIEAALARHAAIGECAVVAREAAPGDWRLVAYFVPAAPGTVGVEELRASLRARLPEHMIPTAFVPLDALPRTANGKLDRKALPGLDQVSPSSDQAYVAPGSALEVRIAALWAQSLRLDRVGVHDNFFAIGGHSLLATQLVFRLRQTFGIELPLRVLMDSPTISELAHEVERCLAGGRDTATPAGLPRLIPDPARLHEPFALTSVQQAYWAGRSGLFDLGTGGANGYFELHFEGFSPLTLVTELSAAFRRLIARHPMLRLVVLPDGRQQILDRVPPYAIGVADLRRLSAAATAACLLESRDGLRNAKAPLDRWPLFELRAFVLDGGQVRLQTRFELIALDGVMRILLFSELFDLLRRPDLDLPPVECTYRDFAQAWEELRRGPAFGRAREFWLDLHQRMPDAPELPLARDPGPAIRSRFVDHSEWILPKEAWSRLKSRLVAARLTPTALVTTTFCEVLAAWGRSTSFTLAMSGVCKPPLHPQIERIIGNFNTVMPLPVEGMEGDLAARVRRLLDTVTAGLDHDSFSGFDLAREIGRRRGGSSRTPFPVLFDSLLELQHQSYGYLAGELGPDARVGYAEDSGLYVPQFQLIVFVGEMGGALHQRWRFVEGVFPPGLIPQMAAAHRRRIESLAADPAAWEAPWPEVARFLVPPAALAADGEPGCSPAMATLTSLCAERTAQHPDSLALIAPDLALTYRELAARAAGLAAALRRAGVARGSVVAIAYDEGSEVVVAMLAVLQAGAAFLAADPREAGISRGPLLARCDAILTTAGEEGENGWPSAVPRLYLSPSAMLAKGGAEDGPRATPDDPAFVLPAPRAEAAACFDHRAGLLAVQSLLLRCGIGPADRLLNAAPLRSEQGLFDLFAALCAGATVVLAPPAARLEAAVLRAVVAREKPSVWSLTPALCERLVACAEAPADRPLPMPRCAVLRGDSVPVRLPARLAALAPRLQAWLVSGAFGAAFGSLCQPLDEIAAEGAGGGLPLPGQTVHVLGPELEPRPLWAVGEVYLEGPTLARAFLGPDAAPAARLLTHPRGGEPLLRTGLLARRLPADRLEWLGAPAAEVRILGYRVWLRRIEACLEGHPAVRGALVQPVPGAAGRIRPWAFVLPAAGRRPTAAELRQLLAQSLPYYMLPAGFTFLEDWPLTSAGAVDRSLLPTPANLSSEIRDDPQDTRVGDLCQLWADMLGLDRVGGDDDFFAAGGDSLSLVRMLDRVGERPGQGPPPLWEFFHEPTPRCLARLLRAAAIAREGAAASGVPWHESIE